MNHKFILFSGGYFHSEQGVTQIKSFAHKKVHVPQKEWCS